MADHIEVIKAVPNWRNNVVESYEFKTDIVESQSGREQRRALRRKPRMVIEFKANPTHADLDLLRRQLVFWGSYPFIVPDWVRKTYTSAPVSAGVNVIPVSGQIPGVKAGDKVVLNTRAATTPVVLVVQEVRTSSLVFTSPVLTTVEEGSELCLAYTGYIPPGMQSALLTDRVSDVQFRFQIDPGTQPATPAGAAGTTFMGLEIMPLLHNWGASLETSHDYIVYDVDFGRGPIVRYHPVSYNRPAVRWSMRNMSRSASDAAIAFFQRMKGRLRVCYVPSMTNDLPPKANPTAGQDRFKVAGLDTLNYWDAAVQRAIMVEKSDGSVIYRRVISMTQSGADTEIRVDTPWPTGISIRKVSWMTRSRLASDLLVVTWRTDTISECDMTFITLEDPQ